MTKKVIDFNRLPKQEYMKPVMRTVELKHRTMILAGSVDSNGMNKKLRTDDEPVDEGW